MPELAPLPWLYPYREDPYATQLGEPVFRPFVEISLAHDGESTAVLDGLVDTGADAILASDLLAEQLGIDLSAHEGETPHALEDRGAMRWRTPVPGYAPSTLVS